MMESRPFAGTKIVCTIGPATESVEMLERLILAGMDVVRLNFSHGTHEHYRTVLRNVREASERTGRHIAILQDLGGPKIRTGMLKDKSVELKNGAEFRITTEDIIGDASRVSTIYKDLPHDVKKGDEILIDDGKLRLEVSSVEGNDVVCRVIHGGVLGEKKGINLPGVTLSTPSLTPKDIEDVRFGLSEGVDYVALSFVRRASDLRDLRAVIERATEKWVSVPIIAKIEKREALEDLDAILLEADGVMVARGDLGVEMLPEDVPLAQKTIVLKCNEAGVPVIIATQMLESMVENPRPTRAETTDVANAVLDGADAVMLSGETSVGRFPVETVEVMDRIIRRAETRLGDHLTFGEVSQGDVVFDAVARSACLLAKQVGASCIVPVTHSGSTAIRLSRYRPAAKIVAVTKQAHVLRKLNLIWGVEGFISNDPWDDAEPVLEQLKKQLIELGHAKPGDMVVFTVGMPITRKGRTNTIKLGRL
jgi:pyruvate kinase